MPPIRLFIACALIYGLFGLPAGGHADAGTPAMEPLRPLVDTLENGLTIVVLEHHTAPVVTVQGWVRAGSTTEGDRTGAGLSHFLEHMLFKGTERRSVGQMGRDVKAIGGHTNAYTSFDRTVYYINCDSAGVNDALDILTDVLTNATFDPEEIERERVVIVKEMNMTRDNPGRWAARQLFQTAFIRHPYRHPVIGYESQLRAVTREDLVAYYRRLYVPNNMALIVVGDVDGPAVLAEAKRLWEPAPRRGLSVPVRAAEPPQLAPRSRIEERDAQLAHVALGFHGPAFADDDLFAMDVLSLILGGGRTSRLFQAVREEQGLVHGIHSFSYTPRDPGLFGVMFSADPDKRDAALAAIMAEITRLQERGVEPRELDTAKRKVLASYFFGRETAEQIADSLGTGLILAGTLQFDERYVAGIQAVTAADVQRVARRYLTDTHRTLSSVVPHGTLQTQEPMNALAEAKPFDVQQFPNGVRLVIRENHASPVVAIRAAVLGGLRSETPATAGLTNLMQTLLPKGTKRWDAAALAREVEARGGEYGAFSGSNSWGVHVQMLAGDWELACQVLDEMLLRPTFPAAEVERERAAILAAIRAQDEDVTTVARRLLRREMYPAHPYQWLAPGTADTVAAFTTDDLRRHHRRLLDPTRLVLVVSGAVDGAALAARLERSVGRLTPPADPWPDPEPPVFAPHAGHVAHQEQDSAQTIIMVAFPGVTVDDPHADVLAVMSAALNGQGGRLFHTLRDEQGLAYGVWFGSTPGLDRGLVTFYIATVAEKRGLALAGLLEQIGELRAGGLTAEEITDARRVLMTAQAGSLETNGSFAFSVSLDELYGLGATYYQTLEARLKAVTPELTQEVARVLFRQEEALVVDVGPANDSVSN